MPVPKKAASKERNITLRRFANYDINRTTLSDMVMFGCGAVKVYKADLRNYADAIEKIPAFINNYKKIRILGITFNDVNVIVPIGSATKASSVLKFLVNTEARVAMQGLQRLYQASYAYSHRFDLLSMTPEILRNIAGREKAKKNVKGKA